MKWYFSENFRFSTTYDTDDFISRSSCQTERKHNPACCSVFITIVDYFHRMLRDAQR